VYWIEILKNYFSKINLENFKRFCGIILLYEISKEFFNPTFYNQNSYVGLCFFSPKGCTFSSLLSKECSFQINYQKGVSRQFHVRLTPNSIFLLHVLAKSWMATTTLIFFIFEVVTANEEKVVNDSDEFQKK
jgi:hypothetical protein